MPTTHGGEKADEENENVIRGPSLLSSSGVSAKQVNHRPRVGSLARRHAEPPGGGRSDRLGLYSNYLHRDAPAREALGARMPRKAHTPSKSGRHPLTLDALKAPKTRPCE
jgi:hypothetical protein